MSERRFGIPPTLEQRREMFIGKSAPEALTLLISSLPEIETVRLISYKRGLEWVEGYHSFEEQLAMGIAKDTRVSRMSILKSDFWDEQLEDLEKIQVPKDSPFSSEEVAGWYREHDYLEEDVVYIAFSSVVESKLGGIELFRNIPLMDFRCRPSKENLIHVKNLLREKGEQQGVILDSGRSYHYYGLRTLPSVEWRGWMKNWYWTLADNFYIAHAILDGNNWLRLTGGVTKPEVPEVVDVI